MRVYNDAFRSSSVPSRVLRSMNSTSSESVAPRLILDEAASGAWNMAVDEMLLETADRRGAVTLRLYEWDRATVSLGYFQR